MLDSGIHTQAFQIQVIRNLSHLRSSYIVHACKASMKYQISYANQRQHKTKINSPDYAILHQLLQCPSAILPPTAPAILATGVKCLA